MSVYKNGHYYELREAKEYKLLDGVMKWRYMTDTHGIPYMDPGSTELIYESNGGEKITLYKSYRGYQESIPWAQNIESDGGLLSWDDGLRKYELKITSIKTSHNK